MLDFYFKDIVSWIKSDKRKSTWTTIYKHWEENGSREYLFCVLFPEKLIDEFVEHASWSLNITNLRPDYAHYSEKDPEYYRWGIESEYEPIIYQQFYNNIFPTKFEIVEEFLQFFNLYFDNKNNSYISVDITSEQNEVVKIVRHKDNIEIKVKTHFLRQFLFAKKLVLGFQMDYFRESDRTLSEQNLNESMLFDEFAQLYNFNICFKDYSSMDRCNSDSRLLAKAILVGYESHNIQTDYERLNSGTCEDFIVDVNNENGDFIYESCNKSEFEETKYGYYTSIFFKREVLLKYYNSPNTYTIEDGSLYMKGSWRLYLDNNNYEFVSAYLGDLKMLPHFEQLYWKSFNIEPQSEVDKRRFNIDFLSSYYDPEIEDLKFKNEYIRVNKLFLKKFGFNLFSEFDENDVHCFKTLRLPLKNEAAELDVLILNLCKVLIDYLNVKSINTFLTSEQKELRSIEKLEIFLEINNLKNFEKIIAFYKTLQKLRSTGSAHRKNSDYKKFLLSLGFENSDEKGIFKALLKDAINILKNISTQLEY
ncbi:hypothetical protein [Epilithonimonas hispanica]|uniref:Uncharacterized protein n=1 Tax=Epilithonimonas hispanica TaxID=358687 RepID=A0A3D9CMQ5_9FLAO|nr:hypothetical protein [Epilithonimonas hispanica]REC67010.1 hypothetical protein DRF58_15725 [Epilithonimonas hispanica]